MNEKLKSGLWFTLIFIACIALFFVLRKQPPKVETCDFIRSGYFKYISGSEDPSAYFVVTGDTIVDYTEYGNQTTTTKIDWVGPCHFTMRIVASSYVEYVFDSTSVVDVRITNVADDEFDINTSGDFGTNKYRVKKVTKEEVTFD